MDFTIRTHVSSLDTYLLVDYCNLHRVFVKRMSFNYCILFIASSSIHLPHLEGRNRTLHPIDIPLPLCYNLYNVLGIVDDDVVEKEGEDENSDGLSSDDSTWNMELPNVTDLSLDSSTEVPGTYAGKWRHLNSTSSMIITFILKIFYLDFCIKQQSELT